MGYIVILENAYIKTALTTDIIGATLGAFDDVGGNCKEPTE